MMCIACSSPRIMHFIDGFGDKRVFCRTCGRSFLEHNFIQLSGQKKIFEFNNNLQFESQLR